MKNSLKGLRLLTELIVESVYSVISGQNLPRVPDRVRDGLWPGGLPPWARFLPLLGERGFDVVGNGCIDELFRLHIDIGDVLGNPAGLRNALLVRDIKIER